jgi:hypothetical protein
MPWLREILDIKHLQKLLVIALSLLRPLFAQTLPATKETTEPQMVAIAAASKSTPPEGPFGAQEEKWA